MEAYRSRLPEAPILLAWRPWACGRSTGKRSKRLQLSSSGADINARAWAAAALGRLERSDLILAVVTELPVSVVIRGFHGPISPFRDHGAHRPLDYGPLETVLREFPRLEPEFEKVMTRGSTYCRLDRDEIPTARAALESPWGVVREHAKFSLEVYGI